MNWQEIYRHKVTDIDAALGCIKSGDRIYKGTCQHRPSQVPRRTGRVCLQIGVYLMPENWRASFISMHLASLVRMDRSCASE